ncbi:MAG: hypothetical protein WBY67_09190 [Pseudolabrys sp.]
MPRTDIIEDTHADDLLWGVDGKDGVAAFLNIKPSRAYYLIGRGVIPVKKHSHRIITASRSKLRRHFDDGEVA